MVHGCKKEGKKYGTYAGIDLIYCNNHKEIFDNFKKAHSLASGYVKKIKKMMNII
jgi:hypothetical protein